MAEVVWGLVGWIAALATGRRLEFFKCTPIWFTVGGFFAWAVDVALAVIAQPFLGICVVPLLIFWILDATGVFYDGCE